MNTDQDNKLTQTEVDKHDQKEKLKNEQPEDVSMIDTVVIDMSHLAGSIAVEK
jgi:hypothetical protein